MIIQPLTLIRRLLETGESGQGLAEYALILGLVFVAAIATLTLLGLGINSTFETFISDFAGASGS